MQSKLKSQEINIPFCMYMGRYITIQAVSKIHMEVQRTKSSEEYLGKKLVGSGKICLIACQELLYSYLSANNRVLVRDEMEQNTNVVYGRER